VEKLEREAFLSTGVHNLQDRIIDGLLIELETAKKKLQESEELLDYTVKKNIKNKDKLKAILNSL